MISDQQQVAVQSMRNEIIGRDYRLVLKFGKQNE